VDQTLKLLLVRADLMTSKNRFINLPIDTWHEHQICA